MTTVLELEHIPDDWMADWLTEREQTMLHADGSNGVHRVQVLQARHGDSIYREVNDLGDAALFGHEPLMVMAGGRSKVGNVRDLADNERLKKTFAETRGLEPVDILGGYRMVVEEEWNKAKRLSTFGPSLRKQRDID